MVARNSKNHFAKRLAIFFSLFSSSCYYEFNTSFCFYVLFFLSVLLYAGSLIDVIKKMAVKKKDRKIVFHTIGAVDFSCISDPWVAHSWVFF